MCNKKISIVEEITSKCKCDNVFCKKHLFYSIHNCTYDYKKNNNDNIVKLDTNKVIKI